MLIKLPERIEYVQCPKCGLAKSKNRWKILDAERLIKETAELSGEVDSWTFTPKDDAMEVEVSGWLDGIRKKELHLVKLKAVKNMCPVCGRLLSGYYEAQIQLRGGFEGPVLQWIEEEVARLAKSDRMAFCRHEFTKHGIDVYFGSKQAAKSIAQGLKKRFGAELTTSFQTVGRKGGKALKRTYISARFPNTLK